MQPAKKGSTQAASGRLSKADRRRQLLEVALVIIREEGADRLTLGHLATRAGVSKPITYEHFGTRAGLLAELYKLLDRNQIEALREALKNVEGNLKNTADVLATAYIRCGIDSGAEWQAVVAALTGTEAMSAVHQELLDGYVELFISTLEPYSTLAPDDLRRRCVGLVGASEALWAMMIGGRSSEEDAAQALSSLIQGALNTQV